VGADPAFREAAVEMARALAARELALVYGGARVGLMGVVADAVLAAGGEVIGVIPKALVDSEIAHDGLDDLRVVGSMHERKALMSELSDGAVALPGGMGTFEEILEFATWSQLGIHSKPCGLLNVNAYYEPLRTLLDHAVRESFTAAEQRGIVFVEDRPETLLERLAGWTPPRAKWAVAGRSD
jgi:uncharacterized protein (TIGR00730 family)